jgi:hypothetical protein
MGQDEIRVVHTNDGRGICPECGNGIWPGQEPCEHKLARMADDQGKGAKALDDEPGSGDRMSASQHWLVYDYEDSDPEGIAVGAEGAEASREAGYTVKGPYVPAEQLQVAVEENTRLRGALAIIAAGTPTDAASYAESALVWLAGNPALGESQEEM